MDDPNLKGSVGELAVMMHLVSLGYHVFNSVTKHSKIDLMIVSPDYQRSFKVQIKTTTSKDHVIKVHTKKTCLNPKYNSNYLPEHADTYAVYVEDMKLVFFIPPSLFLEHKKSIAFRTRQHPPMRIDIEKNRYVEDFLEPKL